jgi:2-isopropylmalate synthase
MSKIIKIFDTTLRDGEQSPGFSMNTGEKIQVARQLDKLGVDVIEAGFPVTSPDDFEAVQKISQIVQNAEVCALARSVDKDIKIAFEAVKNAKKPKIHTFIATSDIHLKFKLKKTQEEVLEMAVRAVKLAKSLVPQVVFSPEDATRSNLKFLYQVLEEIIKAGADVINIPDTVGYSTPEEFREFILNISQNVKGIENVIISTHCQNDLGMATANSLSGVLGGATEIQCTINGIGERAGNASLEEVVMALATRSDFYGFQTNIKTQEIYNSSRLITTITGVPVQPNKAIVGANAFAHESGIHQDGVLKNPETYEIMKAQDIGLTKNKLVLGKHSGRHALKNRLAQLNYLLNEEDLNKFYDSFKILADKKKEVFDEDLYLILSHNEPLSSKDMQSLILENLLVKSGTNTKPEAKVQIKILDIEEFKVKNLIKPEYLSLDQKNILTAICFGDGPVDACFGAINKIINLPNQLLEYSVNSVTAGIDAQATVNTKVKIQDKIFTSSSSDTDIIVASTKAYLDCLSKSLKFFI